MREWCLPKTFEFIYIFLNTKVHRGVVAESIMDGQRRELDSHI